jgi:hypothetical protein
MKKEIITGYIGKDIKLKDLFEYGVYSLYSMDSGLKLVGEILEQKPDENAKKIRITIEEIEGE